VIGAACSLEKHRAHDKTKIDVSLFRIEDARNGRSFVKVKLALCHFSDQITQIFVQCARRDGLELIRGQSVLKYEDLAERFASSFALQARGANLLFGQVPLLNEELRLSGPVRSEQHWDLACFEAQVRNRVMIRRNREIAGVAAVLQVLEKIRH